MEILSVYDSAFKPYGRVVEGYPTEGLVKALATTPCTDGVVYLPRVEVLHNAPNAAKIGEGLYGGMPYELGYCNGHNTKLNCLEFHRDSEFNLGTDDFILLLATLSDLEDGELDTAKVKAFKVPAGWWRCRIRRIRISGRRMARISWIRRCGRGISGCWRIRIARKRNRAQRCC